MKRHHTLAAGPICYCVPGGASSCATCREQRALKERLEYPMIEYGLGYHIAPLKREGQPYDRDPGGMVDEKGIRVLGPTKTFAETIMTGGLSGIRSLPVPSTPALDRMKAYIDELYESMYVDQPACNTGLSKAFREFWSTEDAEMSPAELEAYLTGTSFTLISHDVSGGVAHPVPAGHVTLDCPEDLSEESLIREVDPEGSGQRLWAWFLRGAE